MQGMALVRELAARKNVDSAIMVISGMLESEDVAEAVKFGAVAAAHKMLGRAVMPPIERLADMARRRRLHKAQKNTGLMSLDSSRLERPVFLSYAAKDDVLANGLRRNIEARGIPVWYAPTPIPPGDPWKARVEAGIREARIFWALFTDSHILSAHGIEELTQFQSRIDRESEPGPFILPVLSELSKKARRSDSHQQIADGYQCVDISNRFIDGLTALLLRIENFFGYRLPGPQKNRARAS
jgi:hypothetical protein